LSEYFVDYDDCACVVIIAAPPEVALVFAPALLIRNSRQSELGKRTSVVGGNALRTGAFKFGTI
jgi:hypothetical protein